MDDRDTLANLIDPNALELDAFPWPRDAAERVLASDWLAARDARVKAEALEEAAADLDTHFQDLPSWTESYKAGERSDDWMRGATRIGTDAIQRLRDRAAELRDRPPPPH